MMRIDEAIEHSRRAATQKGDFAQPAAKDHALHASLVEAWRALEEPGVEGREAFCALLALAPCAVLGGCAAPGFRG